MTSNNSRQRVSLALDHNEPDCVPLDLGATPVSGMHVSTVYKLRQALKLDKPGTPVKVVEPYQMLGEISCDLIDTLGVDLIGLSGPRNLFGFKSESWKPWTLFDGTPVLVPAAFNTVPDINGDILLYPEGDSSVPASGRLKKGGWYFDAIIRQPPVDDTKLNVEDNLEEFTTVSDDVLDYYSRESDRLYRQTDKAIVANFGGTAFGDIALVPAPFLKNPKGIRDIEEWYISTAIRSDYIHELFERQCEIAIANLKKIHQSVGDRVSVLFVSGTDFGTQRGLFISKIAYGSLYKPFHKRVNEWVHKNTKWKTFIHTCGSIYELIDEFIDAGFDILNPVQCSAVNMDARRLKEQFGTKITFWGGGVDTQQTLPFGTPEQVRSEVKERMAIFSRGGGFIFNPIHNIQARTPVENLLALYETVRNFRK